MVVESYAVEPFVIATFEGRGRVLALPAAEDVGRRAFLWVTTGLLGRCYSRSGRADAVVAVAGGPTLLRAASRVTRFVTSRCRAVTWSTEAKDFSIRLACLRRARRLSSGTRRRCVCEDAILRGEGGDRAEGHLSCVQPSSDTWPLSAEFKPGRGYRVDLRHVSLDPQFRLAPSWREDSLWPGLAARWARRSADQRRRGRRDVLHLCFGNPRRPSYRCRGGGDAAERGGGRSCAGSWNFDVLLGFLIGRRSAWRGRLGTLTERWHREMDPLASL